MKNNRKYIYTLMYWLTAFLGAHHTQAQPFAIFDTKITYEVRFLGDSTNSQSVRTELAHLLINKSLSLFEFCQSAALDSATYLVQDEKEQKRLLSELNQGLAIPYKILKKGNRMTTYDLLFNDRLNTSGIGFYYDEAIPEWSLTADTSNINGVLCQKAITELGNRTWTAWFTTEIPISDGPYKFAGLPGLVVQVQDEQAHWLFNLTDITNAVNYAATLNRQLDFEQISSKKKFLAAKRSYSTSILEKEELRTGRKYTADTRAIIEKRLQSMLKGYSNWIELDSTN